MAWMYRPCKVAARGPSAWCRAAIAWLQEMDPGGRSLGCFANRPNSANPDELSVHACGRAVDWRPSSFAMGQWLNHVIVHSGSKDVQLVIWNRQQWGGARGPVFRPYRGPDPHTSHLHIESRNMSPA